MGGGKLNKPVAYDILVYETRQFYYLINNTPIFFKEKFMLLIMKMQINNY